MIIFLKKSLKKPTLWQAYKYYERRALIYGVTRVSISKYKKLYWENRPKTNPVVY